MPRQLVHVTEPSGETSPPPPGSGRGDCGVRIVEFVPNPDGSDSGREWVKLYNSCDDSQSLGGLSLGWGGSAYGSDRSLGLSGELAGKSCMIIGGSVSDESNGSPDIDVEAVFSPGLQNGGADADALAVFASPRSELGSSSVPMDAVIYGSSDNSNELVDHTGLAPEPHNSSRPGDGQSYRLVNGQWEHGTPAPGDCPDF